MTRNTPNQLIIADVPWLIGAMLIAFILIFVGAGFAMLADGEWWGILFGLFGGGMGAIAFVLFVRRVQIIFDRANDSIVVRRRSVFGYSQAKLKLSDLDRAILEHSTNSDGDHVERPTLVFGGGPKAGHFPIVDAYTNTGGPKRLVNAVNDWLDA